MDRLNFYYEKYEERAAIKQHDGDFPKVLAEKRAFYEIVHEYCDENKLNYLSDESDEFINRLKNKISKEVTEQLINK